MRVLDRLDVVPRTSQLARIFGILFFAVLERCVPPTPLARRLAARKRCRQSGQQRLDLCVCLCCVHSRVCACACVCNTCGMRVSGAVRPHVCLYVRTCGHSHMCMRACGAVRPLTHACACAQRLAVPRGGHALPPGQAARLRAAVAIAHAGTSARLRPSCCCCQCNARQGSQCCLSLPLLLSCCETVLVLLLPCNAVGVRLCLKPHPSRAGARAAGAGVHAADHGAQ